MLRARQTRRLGQVLIATICLSNTQLSRLSAEDKSGAQPAVGHEYGGNNVDEPPIFELRPDQAWPLKIETHHVQGLCVDANTFWVSTVNRPQREGWLLQIDRATLHLQRKIRLVRRQQYHPGGMQLRGGKIWLPLAEYRPRSTATLLQIDAANLTIEQALPINDHVGAVAVDTQNRLYAANWDSRVFYVLQRPPGSGAIKQVANPTGVAYQDIEWHDGYLYASGKHRRLGPVVDVIDTDAWRLLKRYRLKGEVRSGGHNFSREGFCKAGAYFYLLPEDGPHSTVYRFPLPAAEKR